MYFTTSFSIVLLNYIAIMIMMIMIIMIIIIIIIIIIISWWNILVFSGPFILIMS